MLESSTTGDGQTASHYQMFLVSLDIDFLNHFHYTL